MSGRLSRLTNPDWPVLAVLSRHDCPVSIVLSQLSFLCGHILDVRSSLSCPVVLSRLPSPAVLSQLSCPGCPVWGVLSQLSSPGGPAPALLSSLSYFCCHGQTALSFLSFSKPACPGGPVLDVLSWLSYTGLFYLLWLSLSRLSWVVLTRLSG
jgi:hypothetical protein